MRRNWCTLASLMRDTAWRFAVAAGVALALSAGLATAPAMAHGTADQVNDPPSGTSFGCGTSGLSLYQSFTPAMDTLVAFDVVMRVGGSFPAAGVSLALDIHDGTPNGPVIATTTTAVAGPQAPAATVRPHFDLPAPVPGVSGRVLVAELHSPAEAGVPAATYVSWFGRRDDPYPRGNAFGCTANAAADNDYNFVSYGVAAGDAVAEVCPQIVGRVPAAAIQAALADPTAVFGYNQLEVPGRPPGPFNRRRTRLTMHNLATPFHVVYNRLVFRAGCP